MARGLAEAGFTVSLLTPRGALAEHSRFVSRIGYLDDSASPHDWVFAFAAMVKASAPRIVLPCDEVSLRLMQALVLAPHEGMQATTQIQLAALVRESLGDPDHYRASINKLRLPPAAEALGLRVPPYVVAGTLSEAERFAATNGYPVYVKQSHSAAGAGVAFCANAAELAVAFARLSRPEPLALGDDESGRVLVQASIAGSTHYHNAVAWKGELLAGQASEQLAATIRGPASAVRYYHSPELRAMTSAIARGFGVSGIFVPEFRIHADTGIPYLIEVNRRMTQGTHRGAAFGVDLCAALQAAIVGAASPTRTDLDPGEEHFVAHFPLEWMRDPGSRYLREFPVDVPWDEPELVAAIVEHAMASFREARN
jgi:hypothetical protein